MYAIISAGGKQHRVKEGERLRIDLIKNLKKGESLTIDQVLMVGGDGAYKIGQPLVAGAKVEATVVANGNVSEGLDGEGEKGKKILVFKRRRRKQYKKLRGHRQRYTEIQINKISA